MAVQDRFLLIGDSLVDYLGSIGPFTTANEAWDYDRQHYPGASDFDLRSVGENSWAPKFADAWFVGTGRVAGFINAGVSGTKLIGNWDQTSTARTAAQNYYSDNGSPTIRAVPCILGANDVMTGGTYSISALVTAIQSLKTWITSQFAGSPQLYMAIIGRASAANFGNVETDATFVLRLNRVRQAIIEAVDAGYCAIGANLTGHNYGDNVHPDTTQHATDIGYGMDLAITGTLAPRLLDAKIDRAATLIRLQWTQVLKQPGVGAVYRVTDNGTPVSGLSAALINATTVELTWSGGALSGIPGVSLAYGVMAAGLSVPKGVDQSVNATSYAAPAVPFFDVRPQLTGRLVPIGGMS